ncbi:MAG: helix-turn-helix transcriptional regulator [Rubrivivax sp.]|nr:helix-turn-helix transcriptional regulator [Rubrivivax sp.]
MIVTTRFPDLPPRPQTPSNAAFRQAFFARWGLENTVFLASTRQFESMTQTAALSVKLAEQGRATLRVGRRELMLEAGHCLVVNEGEPYSVRISGEVPMRAFSLHFRPGLAAEVATARAETWQRALERGGHEPARSAPWLRDDLHLPSAALLDIVAAVRRRVLEGDRDGQSYEPLFIGALDRLLADSHQQRRGAAASLQAVRASTRGELLRRAGWAHDFIFSHYAEPISLDQIAAAAHLSKYHLLRTFHQVYGQTPHAALNERRAQIAQALLTEGRADLVTVAETAGFGSRWAMQRALRRQYGATARALRGRQREAR